MTDLNTNYKQMHVNIYNDTGKFQTVFSVGGQLRRLPFVNRKHQKSMERIPPEGFLKSRYEGRRDLPPGFIDESLGGNRVDCSTIPVLRREEVVA
jgi:hypothetical protein